MEKNITYNHETNKTSSTGGRKLHKQLFYPSVDNVKGYIAGAIKNKNEDFQFFSSYDGDVWGAVSNIIRNCYNPNEDDGDINVNFLFNAVKEVAEICERIRFVKHLSTTNKITYEQNGVMFLNTKHADDQFIGTGKLTADYEDGDADCYETAGGYRHFKALEGTTVTYRMNHDLTFRCSFDSNCVTDHYNNNIGGVSTGNGTTTYEVGKRVEKRGVTMGREAFNKSWKKQLAPITPEMIDDVRMIEICNEFQPELTDAIMNPNK
jgi:hypothetical protein